MDPMLTPVGQYRASYNRALGLTLPCSAIFQSKGLRSHVLKRHPHCLKYLDLIPEILSAPDYLGVNPKEAHSIEFVKCYDDAVLVAVKLDLRHDYLYVASVYDISESKLRRRIHSQRLMKTPLDK